MECPTAGPPRPARPLASVGAVEDDLALLGVVAAELDGVEAALARIDAGAHGRCDRCGGRVGDERLAAEPLSTTCATCA